MSDAKIIVRDMLLMCNQIQLTYGDVTAQKLKLSDVSNSLMHLQSLLDVGGDGRCTNCVSFEPEQEDTQPWCDRHNISMQPEETCVYYEPLAR